MIKFLKDTSGAIAIEYAFIAGLVSIAIIGGSLALGISVAGTYDLINELIQLEN